MAALPIVRAVQVARRSRPQRRPTREDAPHIEARRVSPDQTGAAIGRRSFVAGSGALALSAATTVLELKGRPAWATGLGAVASHVGPDTVPDPGRPPGTPDSANPIEHVVIVMMENHSFDNYLGMLPRRGHPGVDGFHIGPDGKPTDTNPAPGGGSIRAFRMPSECQMESEPNQSWNATHTALAGGAMNGFVRASGDVAMGYWDEVDLPFYYSLARTFALSQRWFASCPGQTYPNRRFLMAATAYGLVNTVFPGPNDPPPPNGTIFDRLNAYGVPWMNYFTDLPQIAIIPSAFKGNPQHIAPMARFYADAAGGRLPALSLVDPDFGLADVIGGLVPGQPVPQSVRAQGQDEENPQNIQFGEAFVSQVVSAVISSPLWPRTLLVWLYDEHGGYYDHVPPPAAPLPDAIAPVLGPGDFPGRYDLYGVRVPAVAVSAWSRPGYLSNVTHDHTSILRFIEDKWNLPSLTRRDAQANSVLDLLDFTRPALLEPPGLAAPANPLASDPSCTTADPKAPVIPAPRGGAGGPGVAGGPNTGQPGARSSGTLPATGGSNTLWEGGVALVGAAALARTARLARLHHPHRRS